MASFSTIETLPTEMISKIASHLDQPSIYRLFVTSKRLSQATQNSFYQYPTVTSGTERALSFFRLLVSRPELQCLVQTMTIRHPHGVSHPRLVDASLFPVLPNCHRLSMDTWLGSAMLVAFPGLCTLNLHGSSDDWVGVAKRKRFGVKEDPEVQPENLEFRTSSLALTTLRLPDYGLSPKNARPMWESLRGRLKTLEVSFRPVETIPPARFTSKDIEDFSICSTTLTSLKMWGRSNRTAFNDLATILPLLESLSLRVGPPTGMFDKRFEYLVELELDATYWGWKSQVDGVLVKVCHAVANGLLPRLRHLRILIDKAHLDLDSLKLLRGLENGSLKVDVDIAKGLLLNWVKIVGMRGDATGLDTKL